LCEVSLKNGIIEMLLKSLEQRVVNGRLRRKIRGRNIRITSDSSGHMGGAPSGSLN
jgi:hypothetical protein